MADAIPISKQTEATAGPVVQKSAAVAPKAAPAVLASTTERFTRVDN